MKGEENIKAMQEFQKMVDSVFGTGVVSIPMNEESTNITGAWYFDNEFVEFKRNFKARLDRLNSLYPNQKDNKIIQDLIANMTKVQNWDGSYPELVAYDVLNTSYVDKIELNVTRAVSFALTKHIEGRKGANYDMLMSGDGYRVYLEVKSFADRTGEILKNLVESIFKSKEFNELNIHIKPCYPMDDGESEYSDNFENLRKELMAIIRDFLKNDEKRSQYQSGIIPRLSYAITIDDQSGNHYIREYCPYRRAEGLKDFVINRYCDKIPYSAPFFLVFVNFAWYNQVDRNSFEFNRELYRSLARRTFMQYENTSNNRPISEIYPNFTGRQTAKFAARKVTGMIFIDDYSTLEDKACTYVYLNPNADNKCPHFNHILNKTGRNVELGDFDDFEYDNY